ncbi:MAG: hypothetical protein ACRET2_00305 [Steroidobacteraceae bacterium]
MSSLLRRHVPGRGAGRRWLEESLREQGVRIYLTQGCLRELLSGAAAAASRSPSSSLQYRDVLRAEIDARAAFIHRWTSSDEPFAVWDAEEAALVRIARKYALPRPWRVPQPVAAPCTRRVPSYRHWASGVDAAARIANQAPS